MTSDTNLCDGLLLNQKFGTIFLDCESLSLILNALKSFLLNFIEKTCRQPAKLVVATLSVMRSFQKNLQNFDSFKITRILQHLKLI